MSNNVLDGLERTGTVRCPKNGEGEVTTTKERGWWCKDCKKWHRLCNVTVVCVRCGNEREHVANGMCNGCYAYHNFGVQIRRAVRRNQILHPKCYTAYNHKYYLKHATKYKKYMVEWRKKHPEKCRKYSKRYYKKLRELKNEKEQQGKEGNNGAV